MSSPLSDLSKTHCEGRLLPLTNATSSTITAGKASQLLWRQTQQISFWLNSLMCADFFFSFRIVKRRRSVTVPEHVPQCDMFHVTVRHCGSRSNQNYSGCVYLWTYAKIVILKSDSLMFSRTTRNTLGLSLKGWSLMEQKELPLDQHILKRATTHSPLWTFYSVTIYDIYLCKAVLDLPAFGYALTAFLRPWWRHIKVNVPPLHLAMFAGEHPSVARSEMHCGYANVFANEGRFTPSRKSRLEQVDADRNNDRHEAFVTIFLSRTGWIGSEPSRMTCSHVCFFLTVIGPSIFFVPTK